MTTTEYTVRRHSDGKQIGTAILTADQFRRYEAMAQQPEGLLRLGAMPRDWYELAADWRAAHEDTSVFLE